MSNIYRPIVTDGTADIWELRPWKEQGESCKNTIALVEKTFTGKWRNLGVVNLAEYSNMTHTDVKVSVSVGGWIKKCGCYHCEKIYPTMVKKPTGYRPPDISRSCFFFSMGGMWSVHSVIWSIWHHRLSRVTMVIADVLAPIWRQGISNHHDDIGSL